MTALPRDPHAPATFWRAPALALLLVAAATLGACSSSQAPHGAPASAPATGRAPAAPPSTSGTASAEASAGAEPAPAARHEIEALVGRFGRHMQEISTLAPPPDVRTELPQVYPDMLTPQLLAAWQAHPDRVVGRNYGSSPWPTQIVIHGIRCTRPATCVVMGKVDYITSNELEHGGIFMRRDIVLEVARTRAGWRIADARLIHASK